MLKSGSFLERSTVRQTLPNRSQNPYAEADNSATNRTTSGHVSWTINSECSAVYEILFSNLIGSTGEHLRFIMSGAAGFIGSHFCDRLIAEGHQVLGLDNFMTGSARNLEHLRGNSSFEFLKCD